MTVAGRVLARWRRDPASAPSWLDRPGAVTAFLQGAMAPDMGFVPGVDRLVSEVAHYVRPGDLTRNLLAAARSHEEEAFAWGWANHVLVDVEIHPMVGRAVGERLFGSRERRVDALYDVATHVSLEVGLDMALLRTEPDVPRPPRHPVVGESVSAASLSEAFVRTYDLEWDPGDLARAHRRAVALTRWWGSALRVLPLASPGPVLNGSSDPGPPDWRDGLEPGPTSEPVCRPQDRGAVRKLTFAALSRIARSGTAARGFFRPEAPRPWFLNEVRAGLQRCAETFDQWVEDGLDSLQNLNLETGEVTGVGSGHPATDLVHRRLELHGSRGS